MKKFVCTVCVERKRTHLPENDEEASERAPMHFEIFPRVVQYRRSVSVAAGESFGKFLLAHMNGQMHRPVHPSALRLYPVARTNHPPIMLYYYHN